MTTPALSVPSPKKRILFYHHYDADSRIADYVLHFLQAFSDYGIDISFSSNAALPEAETKKLDGLTEKILLRDNRGYDFAAWRDQLQAFGRDALSGYDQIILANSTVYGPLFSLDEIFMSVERADCDFWAPTLHTASHGIPKHLQPYVLVVNQKLHQSDTFWQFWLEIRDDYKDAWDVIWRAEIHLTSSFARAGFKFAAGVELEDNREIRQLGHYEPYVMHAAAHLIKTHRLSFVKVKAFCHYQARAMHQTPHIFDALAQRHSAYPIDKIIRHQREVSPLSWHKNLPGTMVGSVNGSDWQEDDFISLKNRLDNKPIGIFVHLFYIENFGEIIAHLKKMPFNFDLNVTTPFEEIKTWLEANARSSLPLLSALDVRLINNRGRDIAPWIIEFRDKHLDYDLALKLHVKKHPQQPLVFSQLWNDFMFENLMGSRSHIAETVQAFLDDPSCGMAFPTYPPFYNLIYPHGYAGSRKDQDWRRKILDDLSCQVPEETAQPIFSAGGMCWYRPKALRRMFESAYDWNDFPAEPFPLSGTIGHGFERAIPYIAQAEGYNYRILMTAECLKRSFAMYEDRIMSTYNHGQAGTPQHSGSYISLPVTPPGVIQSSRILSSAIKRSVYSRLRKYHFILKRYSKLQFWR